MGVARQPGIPLASFVVAVLLVIPSLAWVGESVRADHDAAAYLPGDDAGSGGDAPGTPVDGARIASGHVYDASLRGAAGDADDHFAIDLDAGSVVNVHWVASVSIAADLTRPSGAPGDPRHSAGVYEVIQPGILRVRVTESGVWFVHFSSTVPTTYRFGIGVDEAAPDARHSRAGPLNARPALLPPAAQDDAGSGGDAPADARHAVPVAEGVVHEGRLDGAAGDEVDAFALPIPQGAETLTLRAWGSFTCFDLEDPLGGLRTFCGQPQTSSEVAFPATPAGSWILKARGSTPRSYAFAYALDGEPPAADPLGEEPRRAPGALAEPRPARPDGEHVVVAMVDTGVNPYHTFFRAPGLAAHPATWLPGFPSDARTLDLTLDAESWGEAYEADGDTWSDIRQSAYDPATGVVDASVYTFPGTRIVAGVTFGKTLGVHGLLDPPSPGILDVNGHGTASAALALGATLGVPDGNVLLVAVQVGNVEAGVRWAARQPWIDALSISIGTPANAPQSGGPAGNAKLGIEAATREAARAGKPVFIASGNGVSGSTALPDHCATYTSAYVGPEWVTRIGAAGPRSGNPTMWHCIPVDAVAKTDVPSAGPDSFNGVAIATGTSAATPNAVGHFAHLLLDSRRAGLAHGATDVLPYLLNASRPAPTAVEVGTEPGTSTTAPLDQGFGLVDEEALARARTALLAGEGPDPRPELDQWRAIDHAIRATLWTTVMGTYLVDRLDEQMAPFTGPPQDVWLTLRKLLWGV